MVPAASSSATAARGSTARAPACATRVDLCVPADRQPSFAAERLRRDLETALKRLRA
jgi:3-hydroxyisobutyrate dehydrogenase-like beta-hydroxyacid dehydrogenase